MPVQQTPQWTEFLTCPVCQKEFQNGDRLPVSLTCGHTICTPCLDALQGYQCPLDQNKIGMEMHKLPVNTALLKLIGNGHVPDRLRTTGDLTPKFAEIYRQCMKCLEAMSLYLKPQTTNQLSRPLQRKVVILVTSQLLNDEGRGKGVRAARSVGERCVLELILQHQDPFHLSTNLWAAVRARGCQFLGPPMQEDVLKLVLNALQDGNALSRKVLVMFVVQRLVKASKTSIGHVVQLLYRASCFKVTKRDGDSSLMQLKDELRNYENLRKEHDTQIVQIAIEAGLRIGPDQWSSLLYGDYVHKSHMQSIIDKLQTPQSFSQSVQELLLALQRFGDPGNLSSLRAHFQVLTSIDSNIESKEVAPGWPSTLKAILAAEAITAGIISFSALNSSKRTGELYNSISRYKTSICRDFSQYGCCVRGPNCTFAHCTAELEYHRTNNNNSRSREQRSSNPTGSTTTSTKPPSNYGHEDQDKSEHKMFDMNTDMKRVETKDLDEDSEEMPRMEPIHMKYFPSGPDGLKLVDTAAPPPRLNSFHIGNKQLIPIQDHDQTKQQKHPSGQHVAQQQQYQQQVAQHQTAQHHQVQHLQHAEHLQKVAQQQHLAQQQQAAQQQLLATQQQQQAAQLKKAVQHQQAAQQQHQAAQQLQQAVQQQQAAQQQHQAAQQLQQAVQQQHQAAQQHIRAEQRQNSVVAFTQPIQQHTIVGATEPMQQKITVNPQMVAPHNAQEPQNHGIINIKQNTASFQQSGTATMATADIAHLQALAAVNQIGASQVVGSHQLANNVNQLPTRMDRSSNLPAMMQDQLNNALSGQQSNGQQSGRSEAVSRAHLNAAVAQGQFNVANTDIISVQPGEFPAPGIGVPVVRPPVQLHIQQIPHHGQAGTVMGIPTQRAIAAPLHQTQTQQTSVMAQMQAQHGTTQMGTGGRVHSSLTGQITEQQMVMVPAGNTQMSPIVDANGSPLIDANTGHPLLAAHTPMIAASPIHQQVIDGNGHAQIIAASPLHQLSDGTIVQNTLQVQAPMRRMSHDVSPELASKSLQALEDRKEEIISELEDIVGPTAAKAIGNLTYKQASKQKFGIDAAVKQTSPAFETTLGNTSLNGIYGIWTSKPIATISSILSNTCKPVQQTRETNTIYTTSTKSQSVEDEVSPLPEGICVSRFGPISRRNIVTNPGIQSSLESLPRSVTSTISSENTLSESGLRNFPRSSLMSVDHTTVTKSRVEERSNVLEYNPGYYFDYMEGMDSVVMNHLANPPMLPASPMPPVKIRDNGLGQQNYNFLVESNRIQNELQELQRRLSCLSVAENSAQMVLKRDRLAFELRMIEGGIQERHQETHTPTMDFPY